MLYVDDAEVVSKSSRGLTRMMNVTIIAYQELGLTVLEETKAMHVSPIPAQRRTRFELTRQDNGMNIPPSICTLVVLSARARTSTSRSSFASAPLGGVSEDTVPNCTTDGTPGCLTRSGHSKRR